MVIHFREKTEEKEMSFRPTPPQEKGERRFRITQRASDFVLLIMTLFTLYNGNGKSLKTSYEKCTEEFQTFHRDTNVCCLSFPLKTKKKQQKTKQANKQKTRNKLFSKYFNKDTLKTMYEFNLD